MRNLRLIQNYFQQLIAAFLLMGIPLFNACTTQPNKSKFDPQAATHLLIAKADPATGDRWLVSLERKSNQSVWKIKNAGIDQEANSNFINHLLDAYRSLKVLRPAPSSTLANLGLDPPKFILIFDDKNEIKIGQSAENEGINILLNSQPSSKPQETPMIGSGSFFQLLDQIAQLDYLRERRLAMTDLDDIDDVTITKKRVFLTHAEREPALEGGFQPLVLRFLRALTEAQVLKFNDDPEENKKALFALNSKSSFEVSLKDRRKNETLIRLFQKGARTIAQVSKRGENSFQINSSLLNLIEALHTRVVKN